MNDTEKQLAKVEKLFSMISEEYVKPEQVIAIFEAISGAIKETKKQIEQNMADNKGEIDNELKDILSSLRTRESNLESLVNQVKQNAGQELDIIAKQLKTEVNRIENLIPAIADPVNIVPLENRISETEDKIKNLPKEKTPEQERDDLESLKGDNRLDISAIKGFSKTFSKLTDDLIARAISIVDNRTSFLIGKTTQLRTDVNTKVTGWGTKNIYVQSTTPGNPSLNDLWVDTS